MNDAGTQANQATAVRGDTGITVRVFGRTDVGLVREHNEDNFLIADLTAENRSIRPEVRTHNVGEGGTLFVVCDGMGGAAAGEVASRIGVDTIYEMMQQERDFSDPGRLARSLEEAIREAGTRIYTAARLNRGQRGMGTTVTAAVLAGSRLVLGQVGDSRAHVIRRGRLVQVTKDQSLVQQLIDAKQLTEEEAKNFDRSNIILQALGTTEEVHVDVTSVMLCRGDALVMCSDGLSGPVEPEEILAIVTGNDEPMEACRLLTERACEKGGDDNITVIVARFEGEGLEPPVEGEDPFYEKYDFPRVTETTVRTPMPRPPNEDKPEAGPVPAADQAKPEEAARPEAAPAATPKPAKQSEQKPEKKPSTPAGEAPAANRKKADVEAGAGGGRAGPIIGVLAVLAIGGLAAAYFGGAFSSSDQAKAEPGAAAVPVAPPPPAAIAPQKRPWVAPAAAPPVEAPPLAPVAAEDIEGGSDDGSDSDGSAAVAKKAGDGEPGKTTAEPKPKPATAVTDEPKTEPETPPRPAAGAEEDETEKKDEAAVAAPVKKAGKKPGGAKSGGADIPDNPF